MLSGSDKVIRLCCTKALRLMTACDRLNHNVKRRSCCFSVATLLRQTLCKRKLLTGPVIAGLCRRGSSHCVFFVSGLNKQQKLFRQVKESPRI